MAPKATRKQKRRNSIRYEELENEASEGEVLLGTGPRRDLEPINPIGAPIDSERVLEASKILSASIRGPTGSTGFKSRRGPVHIRISTSSYSFSKSSYLLEFLFCCFLVNLGAISENKTLGIYC